MRSSSQRLFSSVCAACMHGRMVGRIGERTRACVCSGLSSACRPRTRCARQCPILACLCSPLPLIHWRWKCLSKSGTGQGQPMYGIAADADADYSMNPQRKHYIGRRPILCIVNSSHGERHATRQVDSTAQCYARSAETGSVCNDACRRRELWQTLICWKRKASDGREKSLGGEHARHP
jgi:hypothetical protein